MTLQQIWDKLLLRRQGNTDADLNFQRQITEWANETVRDIWLGEGLAVSPNWWWLQKTATFPTVADQMTYDLPADIDGLKVYDVRQKEDEKKLDYVDQNIFDELIPDPDEGESGNPTKYTLYGRDITTARGYIRLYPIPDAVITMYLRYLAGPGEFVYTDGSSTVLVPPKYDSILLNGVLSRWFEYDPERGNAAQKKSEFYAGINKMFEDNKPIDATIITRTHGKYTIPTLGYTRPIT